MSARQDRVIGLVFVASGLGMALHARSMPVPNLMGDVGPSFFPALIGWSMAALGLVLAAMARGGGAAAETFDWRRVPMTVGFAAIAFLYAAAFDLAGFSWPTFGALVAAMALLGRRDARSLGLYAAGAAVFVLVLGFALKRGLRIPLTGVWIG